MNREDALKKAARLVLKDRESDYGDPGDNFTRIADLWSTYLNGRHLDAYDVAMMLALLKIGRAMNRPSSPDSLVDLVGYGALAIEMEYRAYDAEGHPLPTASASAPQAPSDAPSPSSSKSSEQALQTKRLLRAAELLREGGA